MTINLFIISIILNSQIISQNIFNQNTKTKNSDSIELKTKNCEVFEGLFTIYQSKKDGKSYIEIDTSHLDNEFIYFSYIENGVIQAGAVKGSYRGSKIIKINKYYNKIDFTIRNTKYYFEEDSPLAETLQIEFDQVFSFNDNNKELFLERLDHILSDSRL